MKLLIIFAAFTLELGAATPTGPEIGTKAPSFEAHDQNGVIRNLASSLGPKGAILVFFRSADW